MRTTSDPSASGPALHVAVRLEPAVVARIDALRDELSTDWHTAKRSDVLRAVIARGLPAVEADPSGGGRERSTGRRRKARRDAPRRNARDLGRSL